MDLFTIGLVMIAIGVVIAFLLGVVLENIIVVGIGMVIFAIGFGITVFNIFA